MFSHKSCRISKEMYCHNILILHIYYHLDTYEESIAIEKNISNISTNDEETLADISIEINNNAKKRKVIKPSRYRNTSDSSEENNEPPDFPKVHTNYKSPYVQNINEENVQEVSIEPLEYSLEKSAYVGQYAKINYRKTFYHKGLIRTSAGIDRKDRY
ncbi:uncharacterized protein LOC116851264 [Odontomachus brunneus]|uniref:uncharacterized protein LOC116851264 n=1 Tax=Odontomachus brunneus TaxID=486640 RepID=UPI0013F1E358|nr:uncharacterized protein LOC116851264 [Odontomachus brunneus]